MAVAATAAAKGLAALPIVTFEKAGRELAALPIAPLKKAAKGLAALPNVTFEKVGRGLRSAPESEPPTGRCPPSRKGQMGRLQRQEHPGKEPILFRSSNLRTCPP